jgi:hypothetical protein
MSTEKMPTEKMPKKKRRKINGDEKNVEKKSRNNFNRKKNVDPMICRKLQDVIAKPL